MFDERDDDLAGLLEETALEPAPKMEPLHANPESLLDPETLEGLLGQHSSLPSAFLEHTAGNISNTQAVIDFATTVCMSVADGKLKVSQSAELRKWAELMYSCIVSQSGQGQGTQVNYIGQLVQLAGSQPTESDPIGREIIEVQETIKKAQGE
tara:strand:- start:27382 stop:27840 length:459 start_codon:yes stop_codon:yes gene_type:complete